MTGPKSGRLDQQPDARNAHEYSGSSDVKPPPSLRVSVRERGGTTVVEVAGELDVSTAGELREAFVESIPETEPCNLCLDIRNLTFLSSVGIGLIVSACKRVRAQGGSFSAVCGQSSARRVLEISGLPDYLQLEDDGR